MSQTTLGLLRGLGYPILFAALSALITALPNISNILPAWLPAAILTMVAAAIEHQLAISLGYNLPSTNGAQQ
jgi:hypothetical protein